MFERYTERARRVVFFARYEASQTGSTTIETEHFLLGLLREDQNLTTRLLKMPAVDIRDEILRQISVREKIQTSVDLPLSDECKKILAYAADEAEKLNHQHIGTEHLLLGILREEKCLAAQILIRRGLKSETVREQMAAGTQDRQQLHVGLGAGMIHGFSPFRINPNLPRAGVVPDEQTAVRIAEAIWITIYGEDRVAAQKPFKTELKANIWIVSGAATDETALHVFILKPNGAVMAVGEGPSPKTPI